jgi:hypothetical protein
LQKTLNLPKISNYKVGKILTGGPIAVLLIKDNVFSWNLGQISEVVLVHYNFSIVSCVRKDSSENGKFRCSCF